ncbi:hypothetical protein BC826DRAFT_1065012, partial [Russula brevipes]
VGRSVRGGGARCGCIGGRRLCLLLPFELPVFARVVGLFIAVGALCLLAFLRFRPSFFLVSFAMWAVLPRQETRTRRYSVETFGALAVDNVVFRAESEDGEAMIASAICLLSSARRPCARECVTAPAGGALPDRVVRNVWLQDPCAPPQPTL